MNAESHFLGPAARVGAAALYSVSVVPVVLYPMSVMSLAGIIFMSRSMLLFFRMLATGRQLPRVDLSSGSLFLCLAFLQCLDSVLFFTAAMLLPLGISVMIFTCSPLLTLLFASIQRQKWPPLGFRIAASICFLGAVLTSEPWSDKGSGKTLGYLVAALNATVDSLLPFVNKALLDHGLKTEEQLNTVSTTIAFVAYPIVALVASLCFGFHKTFHLHTSWTLLRYPPAATYIWLCIFGHALAGMLATIAYTVGRDFIIAALSAFSDILFGIVVQIYLLHEPSYPLQIVGAVFVCFGLVIVAFTESYRAVNEGASESTSLLVDLEKSNPVPGEKTTQSTTSVFPLNSTSSSPPTVHPFHTYDAAGNLDGNSCTKIR